MTPLADGVVRLHSSTIAFPRGNECAGLVILGRSGAGKSELALQLMAIGALLVADDQTEFRLRGSAVIASAPTALHGQIEMRGMGLLHAPFVVAQVCAVVDLDHLETARMPPPRAFTLLGQDMPLFHRIDSTAFAAALRLYILSAATLLHGAGGNAE